MVEASLAPPPWMGPLAAAAVAPLDEANAAMKAALQDYGKLVEAPELADVVLLVEGELPRALQCAGGAERVLSRAAAVGDAGGEGAAGDPDGGGERAGVPGGAALSVHGGVAGVGGASGPGDERRGGWIGGGRERRTLERRRRAARRTRRWDAQRWSSRY